MHGIVARKLFLKRSADGPEEVIDDVPRLRQILYDLQRPFLQPENILVPLAQEGDLTLWWNRGLRHTAMEYPNEGYGDRLCHQVHVSRPFLSFFDRADPSPSIRRSQAVTTLRSPLCWIGQSSGRCNLRCLLCECRPTSQAVSHFGMYLFAARMSACCCLRALCL